LLSLNKTRSIEIQAKNYVVNIFYKPIKLNNEKKRISDDGGLSTSLEKHSEDTNEMNKDAIEYFAG
jgi:hypothetical protein